MPLSEHEQRLLSEMEQQLLAEDPRFASAMRHSTTGGQSKQRLALGLVGVLVGLTGMLIALYYRQVPLAVVAFVVMLASAYWAITNPRRKGPAGVVTSQGTVRPRPRGRRGGSTAASSQGFVQRMEQRWERRREQ